MQATLSSLTEAFTLTAKMEVEQPILEGEVLEELYLSSQITLQVQEISLLQAELAVKDHLLQEGEAAEDV